MGNPILNIVENPLGFVDSLFNEHTSGGVREPSADEDWGVQHHIEQSIKDIGIDKVPVLEGSNMDLLANNSLVRFRGMVQDMFNPEFYLGAYTTTSGAAAPPGHSAAATGQQLWCTTKYREVGGGPEGHAPHLGQQQQVWERRVLYCVPVPGESRWCRQARGGIPTPLQGNISGEASVSSAGGASGRSKRDRSVDEGEDEDMTGTGEPTNTTGRQRLDPQGVSGMDADVQDAGEAKQEAAEKANLMNSYNLPLPSETAAPCIVKMYGTMDADLKLNDVVDFIGVLCKDPEIAGVAAEEMEEDAFMADEMNATNPPCSHVVRLHALLASKVEVPSPPLPSPSLALTQVSPQEMQQTAQSLRPLVLATLTSVLGGDQLAAEYVLLALLGRVYHRADPFALGSLALNLRGCPEDNLTSTPPAPPHAASLHQGPPQDLDQDPPLSLFGQLLSQTMEALLPMTSTLPLTIDILNDSVFAPKKDYSRNVLEAGRLQLSGGTLLLVDETVMQPGRLLEPGLHNLEALKTVIEGQKVSYDFQYYQMDMPVDIPVVTLSVGNSLLPTHVCLPLRATQEPKCNLPDETTLGQLRTYLACVRFANHNISEEVSSAIQEQLVSARQGDKKLTQDDFHRWLTLVRLYSLSHGETDLSIDRWHQMRQMESTREERMRVC